MSTISDDDPIVASLVEQLRSMRVAERDVFGALDPTARDRPIRPGDWSPKDHQAHLTAWKRIQTERMRAAARGETVAADTRETDELNARFHAADRARSLADVSAGERAAYERMLAAIDGAADEELFDGSHFAWTDGDRLADWFRSNGDEHYDEHLEQLIRPAR